MLTQRQVAALSFIAGRSDAGMSGEPLVPPIDLGRYGGVVQFAEIMAHIHAQAERIAALEAVLTACEAVRDAYRAAIVDAIAGFNDINLDPMAYSHLWRAYERLREALPPAPAEEEGR